jgi:hypothetical protein
LQLWKRAGFYIFAMQNEPSNLPESLWRRKTSPASAEGAGASADQDLELFLTKTLSQLKDVPVSSNFTARLMDEINREEMRQAAPPRWRWNLWPRLATAFGALLLTGILVQHHETVAHRVQLAQTLAMVADMHSLPSVDALKNFDAIEVMSQPAHADEELLALAP